MSLELFMGTVYPTFTTLRAVDPEADMLSFGNFDEALAYIRNTTDEFLVEFKPCRTRKDSAWFTVLDKPWKDATS